MSAYRQKVPGLIPIFSGLGASCLCLCMYSMAPLTCNPLCETLKKKNCSNTIVDHQSKTNGLETRIFGSIDSSSVTSVINSYEYITTQSDRREGDVINRGLPNLWWKLWLYGNSAWFRRIFTTAVLIDRCLIIAKKKSEQDSCCKCLLVFILVFKYSMGFFKRAVNSFKRSATYPLRLRCYRYPGDDDRLRSGVSLVCLPPMALISYLKNIDY